MKDKFKVVIPNDLKKKIDKMLEKDKADIKKAIEKLARNPYQGTRIGAPWYVRVGDKWLWLKREISLRLKGK